LNQFWSAFGAFEKVKAASHSLLLMGAAFFSAEFSQDYFLGGFLNRSGMEEQPTKFHLNYRLYTKIAKKNNTLHKKIYLTDAVLDLQFFSLTDGRSIFACKDESLN
jgi:hypothetical protein